MDYLFEFAWSLKTCLIPFADNSQNWKRCKIKEGKRLFLKPASYSSWSWMLVEAWSLQTTACFQRALIANFKNISFWFSVSKEFLPTLFYSCTLVVWKSLFSHPVSSLICAHSYDSSIGCSFILVFFDSTVTWVNKLHTSWSALQINWNQAILYRAIKEVSSYLKLTIYWLLGVHQCIHHFTAKHVCSRYFLSLVTRKFAVATFENFKYR